MPNKTKYAGVFHVDGDEKHYYFRVKLTLPDGKKVDTTRKKDSNGNAFTSAKVCSEARELYERQLKNSVASAQNKVFFDKPIAQLTMADVYHLFQESKEAENKARSTLRKFNSIWDNHIKECLGTELINEPGIREKMYAFLTDKYNKPQFNARQNKNIQLTFGYCESFIKFFYLIFAFANRNQLLVNRKWYEETFLNEGTRLTMPKKRQIDIEREKENKKTLNDYELQEIEKIITATDPDLLPAFKIALETGMRVGEVFALTWDKVVFSDSIIIVNRQLQYNTEDERFELCELKTGAALRRIVIPDTLYQFLAEHRKVQRQNKNKYGDRYKDREAVKDVPKNKVLYGADFINRRKNGELLTPNSLKKISKKIREAGFDFHFHLLRKTYGTRAAAQGMVPTALMNQMGHTSITTTNAYYLNPEDEKMLQSTKNTLNSIFNDDTEEKVNPIIEKTVRQRNVGAENLEGFEDMIRQETERFHKYMKEDPNFQFYVSQYFVIDENGSYYKMYKDTKGKITVRDFNDSRLKSRLYHDRRIKRIELEKYAPIIKIKDVEPKYSENRIEYHVYFTDDYDEWL